MDKHDGSETLRLLPSIDALLHSEIGGEIARRVGAKHLTVLARTALNSIRREISEDKNGRTNYSREELLKTAEERLALSYEREENSKSRRVINATGVIIHTNLGRAPLSENARQALIEIASGYCNLEYDVAAGKRGRRGARAAELLAELTGAESALIVNNCAAAMFLVLTVFAQGGEAIISRGELVEIGGDFRIPDVMVQSGAVLKEVGTTNRTRISDYERAVNENTHLIVKVHPSNYRIVGFTAAPNLTELAELARKNNFLLYEDAGSGALSDLSEYGLTDEPVISDSIKAGADIVTFSGDKLLGGAQSGLIVGRRDAIEKIRKHPLYRALRVDKLIYAALEATLEAHRKETALQEIPVLKMLSMSGAEIKQRVEKFAERLGEKGGETQALKYEIIEGSSVVGGGSAPTAQTATALLAMKHSKMSAANLEEKLRLSKPPIIARILEDRVLIDLRTVNESEEKELLDSLNIISAKSI